jgi:hypothetical protein
MLAEQNVEGWVRLPREFLWRSARLLSSADQGNSMNLAEVSGDRIEDSGLILVRRQDEAKNGDAVVAVLDGEVTANACRLRGLLRATAGLLGDHHESFLLNAGFRIQGVVKRVFKHGSDILEREEAAP